MDKNKVNLKHMRLNKNLSLKTYILCNFLISLLMITLSGCGSKEVISGSYIPLNYLKASVPITSEAIGTSTPNHRINSYDALNVPTYITKVDELYFIVDCYHNQVLFSASLNVPLKEWQVMTSDISMGHTLASDGIVYLIDDTENNRILIMEKNISESGEISFAHTQEFIDIGNRPHYIVYDKPTDTFYAWSSLTGEMYLFRHPDNDPSLYLTEIRSIDSLKNTYVRSFSIIGDEIYFVSGNSSIIKADLNTFAIVEEYPVPSEISGMIQLTLIEDYYYLTISTDATGNQDFATIIRTKDLRNLADGDYEDVYHHFIGGGTPYYISSLDNKWFMTEHRIPGHSIFSFEVHNNMIENVKTIY